MFMDMAMKLIKTMAYQNSHSKIKISTFKIQISKFKYQISNFNLLALLYYPIIKKMLESVSSTL